MFVLLLWMVCLVVFGTLGALPVILADNMLKTHRDSNLIVYPAVSRSLLCRKRIWAWQRQRRRFDNSGQLNFRQSVGPAHQDCSHKTSH